jgi:hypothetical protein
MGVMIWTIGVIIIGLLVLIISNISDVNDTLKRIEEKIGARERSE